MKKKKFVGRIGLLSLVLLNLTTLSVYADVTDYQMADTGVEETSAECQVIYKSTYDFSEEIPKYPEIEVSAYGYEGVYDGEYHGISVDCRTDGCQILYSEDGVNFTSMKPEYKEPGTYVVYYKILRDNYAIVTCSSTVTIKPKEDTVSSNNQNSTDQNNKSQNSSSSTDGNAETDISKVQTGDDDHILFYSMMLMASVIGLKTLKRREEKRKL